MCLDSMDTTSHTNDIGRFYGPYAASLPDELNTVLDDYSAVLELEIGGTEAYLFHPVRSGAIDRPVESSAWTSYVKALFARLIGTAVAPKTLRSIFITWIRENTECPEILKSAAHAMKHKPETQASAQKAAGYAGPRGRRVSTSTGPVEGH